MNDALCAAFAAAALLLPAARPADAGPEAKASAAPYYRVFRGARRADLAPEDYVLRLSSSFIPALPATYADKGALAYLAALPPASKPAGLPDEFALVAWKSESAFKAAIQTPAGRRHGDMHWDVFDRALSRGVAAAPFKNDLVAETAYDVLVRPVDWQKGYSTVYVGLRDPKRTPAEFLEGLRKHVVAMRDALAPRGADGYIFVGTDDYELAFLHWPSRKAADAAFASDPVKAAAATAEGVLVNLQFSPTEPFAGSIKPGQAVNVRFGLL